jgi:hypothetical protein
MRDRRLPLNNAFESHDRSLGPGMGPVPVPECVGTAWTRGMAAVEPARACPHLDF